MKYKSTSYPFLAFMSMSFTACMHTQLEDRILFPDLNLVILSGGKFSRSPKYQEWRGAAKFYMLRNRSEQRSNSNQTSAFLTSAPLLSLTQVNLNVFRRAFT